MKIENPRNRLLIDIISLVITVISIVVLIIYIFFDTSEQDTSSSPNQKKTSGGDPNIIIILADDLGYGSIGYNNPKINTPNLDRIAQQGIIFDRFYASPACTPTRSGLLTGMDPIRLGTAFTVILPEFDDAMPTDVMTMGELLKQKNYRTGAIGKWHLGHADRSFYPNQRGFDHFYGTLIDRINYFTPYVPLKELEAPLAQEVYWQRNGEYIEEEGYVTNLLANEAIRFIESDDSRPWFLYLPFTAPHSPMQAPESYLEKYCPGKLKKNKKCIHNTMLYILDEQIGRIVEAIKDQGRWENTIFFFFGDNGSKLEFGDNLDLRGDKGSVYEGGIRVPAFISWPEKLKIQKRTDLFVRHYDLFVTLQELLGINVPPKDQLDGINILAYLLDEKLTPTLREFYFFGWTNTKEDVYDNDFAVISGTWKLVLSFTYPACEPRFELFSIVEDAQEKNDISAIHPERVKEFADKIIGWYKRKPERVLANQTSLCLERWMAQAR